MLLSGTLVGADTASADWRRDGAVRPKRLAGADKAGSRGAQVSTATATEKRTRTGPEMGAPGDGGGGGTDARVWRCRRGESRGAKRTRTGRGCAWKDGTAEVGLPSTGTRR